MTPPTKRSRRGDKQPKTGISCAPDYATPVAQDAKLDEQAFSQKEKSKKATSNVCCDVDSNTQLEASAANEPTEDSPREKRALTPPWIPEKGPLQIWPDWGFGDVSKEGVRALRSRPIRIHCDEPTSRTAPMTRHRLKRSRRKANQKQASAEKYSSTVSAKSSEEEHIGDRITKRTRKSRLQLANSLLNRLRATSVNVADNKKPASQQDQPAVPATGVQRPWEASSDTDISQ